MTQELKFSKDANGSCAYAPEFPSTAYSCTLVAASEKTITVPSDVDRWILAIGYSGSPVVWVAKNETAAPPSGGDFASTTSILNPAQVTVYAGDVISLYNNGITQDIGISLYANT
jgi:hypothetical protein